MIYGELDVSVIDELPPGRSPVLTYKISSGKRERKFKASAENSVRGSPLSSAWRSRLLGDYINGSRNG